MLIVEDDDAMRDLVGYALADEGMEVEAVADREAVALGDSAQISRAIVNPLAMHVACDYKQLLVSVSEHSNSYPVLVTFR